MTLKQVDHNHNKDLQCKQIINKEVKTFCYKNSVNLYSVLFYALLRNILFRYSFKFLSSCKC